MTSFERSRLAQQHEYISKGLGFVLHPTIERELSTEKGELRIADVSEEFQFPGSGGEKLPEQLNHSQPVHISFQDIASPEGALREQHGQFDVVAVRLLHVTLSQETWDIAIRNLISLLRPGGWLQWTDWDPLTPRIAAINPAASDAALRDLFIRYVDCLKARKVGTTYRISNSMNQALEDTDSDMYPLVPEVEFTKNVTTGTIIYLQEYGDLSETEAEDLQAKVHGEIEVGKPLLWYDLWCHIARKPS